MPVETLTLSQTLLHVSCGRLGRGDLVGEAVVPAAAEAAEGAAAEAAANSGRVAKYLARYREVQAKRAAMQVRVPCHCLSSTHLWGLGFTVLGKP